MLYKICNGSGRRSEPRTSRHPNRKQWNYVVEDDVKSFGPALEMRVSETNWRKK